MTNKKLAEQIRKARDLMNHGGKHWIKGDEHAVIDPKCHVPGMSVSDIVIEDEIYNESTGEWEEQEVNLEDAYCSIGAMNEVRAAEAAKIELAKAIAPDEMEAVRQDVIAEQKEEWEWNGKGKFVINERHINDTIIDVAEEVIINFNDNRSTTWPDVRVVFTKAARRLSQRKD